ncbi:MAG TPA: hypothetical protein IGS17_05275 [Oscillatoriales cyanobacterium M59_W2019_021]|nr:hypothetical protein [Oscillatoriales cyanobacterium M4454_W2019_049]HIK50326.1 hypothetical protein [Oscillatoriales cyanobacterium M59_W2019_021]
MVFTHLEAIVRQTGLEKLNSAVHKSIALKTAWARFRKNSRGKLTQTELSWSLEQLAAIELIDYSEQEHLGHSGTVSEHAEP